MGRKLYTKEQAAQVRQHILDAAVTLAMDEGIESLSIVKVAREAKVADGTIYLYFKNLQDLKSHVFESIYPSTDTSGFLIHASHIRFHLGLKRI